MLNNEKNASVHVDNDVYDNMMIGLEGGRSCVMGTGQTAALQIDRLRIGSGRKRYSVLRIVEVVKVHGPAQKHSRIDEEQILKQKSPGRPRRLVTLLSEPAGAVGVILAVEHDLWCMQI